jgi:rhodanese-related sulfurtransferase
VTFVKLVLVSSLLIARGGLPMEDLQALKAAGAQIVDVRTPGEFGLGHLSGSVNIPLDQFQARLGEIDPARAVLLCCASGVRSGMAKTILERAGHEQVHNAGPWTRLQ